MKISRGRRVYTQQQRLDYLARFERSGHSQAEFCRRANLSLSTFALWRRAAAAGAAPTFAEVHLSETHPACAVTLLPPNGVKLEVTAATEAMWQGLGLLLKALQA